jgi:hypothetical protein
MALESATFINGLNSSNPQNTDSVSQADDHLRLIKSTVKATFPNISGAVTKSHSQINDLLEKSGGTMTGSLVLSGAPTTSLQAATKAYVDSAMQSLYPVGSIYVNATNSTNPGTLLGFGTWAAFGAGRVMVGFNSLDPLFDTAEETGGSKDAIVVSHTHTATTTITDPGHTHPYVGNDSGASGTGGTGATAFSNETTSSSTTGITASTTVGTTGNSGTNANLQPYITVYMWKRTA